MTIVYRDALEADLPAIVQLLADDPLGAEREDASVPLLPAYLAAFQAIAALDHQRLVVAVKGERIMGTMQLLVVPGLSMRGASHGYIEAVRIVADLRGARGGGAFRSLGRRTMPGRGLWHGAAGVRRVANGGASFLAEMRVRP